MPAPPKKLARGLPRTVATFEPYYSQPYNAITQPDRLDWYLIRRWLPALGPDAFTLLKVLRSLCYWNPKEGTLRDTCQITVDELADLCGMKRSTVYRVLESNEALKLFVEKQPEAIHVEGRTRRLPPRWRVSMDCPIHPEDIPEYERLITAAGRPQVEDEAEKRKSQIEIYEQRKSQREGRKSQNPERKSQYGILKGIDSLPPDSLPIGSIPAEEEDAQTRPTPSHECDPPGDVPENETDSVPADVAGEIRDSLQQAAWSQALADVGQSTGAATRRMLLPHLQLTNIDDETGEAEVLCPSDAIRDQARKHVTALQEALSARLARPVTIRLVPADKEAI